MATAARRRADYHVYRGRLLKAAREIIADRGPGALSVAEVARRAGVNRSTAHAHFGTRDELVAAVTQAYQQPAVDIFSRHGSIGEWLENVVARLETVPGMSRLLLHDLLEGDGPDRAGWARYTGWIRDLAEEEGRPDGPDPEFVALLLTSLNLLWPILAEWHYSEADLPRARAELAEQVRRLFKSGFIDPGPPASREGPPAAVPGRAERDAREGDIEESEH